MTDYSQYSDADLLQMAGIIPPDAQQQVTSGTNPQGDSFTAVSIPISQADAPIQAQVTANKDYGKYSDADLMKMAGIVNPASQAPNSSALDYGRTATDYGLRGLTFGLGNKIANAAGAGYASLATGEPFSALYDEAAANQKPRMDAELQRNPKTAIGSELGGGLVTGGALAGTAGGQAIANGVSRGLLPEASGLFGKGVNALTKAAISGATGAASGGLYGAGTAEPGQAIEGAKQGALLSGSIGAAIPGVTAGLSAVKNAVLPVASDVVRPLAQKAIDFGIPLSRSQIGESKVAKLIASAIGKVPFSGSPGFQRTQQDAYNRAIANTVGETAINNRVTPEVIDNAFTNIGKKFDGVLAGRQIKINDDVLNKLADLESSTQNITDAHAKIVKSNIYNFINDISKDGTISGEKIGSYRSALTKTLQNTRNDASSYLSDLQDIVVDASVDGAPVAKKTLNQARLQYKNLKTIQPLADKAINGDISPSLLLGRVRQSFGNNFSRGGGGDLGDLARIGQTFLKDPIPDSGTAQRAMVYKAMETLGAGGAGYAAAGGTGILPAIAAPVGIARGFNTLNTNQALLRRALQLQQPQSALRTLLPDILAGQTALQNQGAR